MIFKNRKKVMEQINKKLYNIVNDYNATHQIKQKSLVEVSIHSNTINSGKYLEDVRKLTEVVDAEYVDEAIKLLRKLLIEFKIYPKNKEWIEFKKTLIMGHEGIIKCFEDTFKDKNNLSYEMYLSFLKGNPIGKINLETNSLKIEIQVIHHTERVSFLKYGISIIVGLLACSFIIKFITDIIKDFNN